MKYAFFFFCFVLFACNNESASTTAGGTTANSDAAPASGDTTVGAGGAIPSWDSASLATLPACFAYQTSNDIVRLKLNTVTPTVSGDLEYAFMGKDKNKGTISGAMNGDTLLANYTFTSEGKSSVRQVAFLKRPEGFVEGYGDSKQEGNKMVFTNRGTLNFGGNMILKKVPCTP